VNAKIEIGRKKTVSNDYIHIYFYPYLKMPRPPASHNQLRQRDLAQKAAKSKDPAPEGQGRLVSLAGRED
jgi:hypothetical protein